MRPEAGAGVREPRGRLCHCPGDDPRRPPPPPRRLERLYLPISKRQEYLQGFGEKVLASFPVQATLHFYNDDPESESEEELEEDAQPCHLQGQWMEGLQGSSPGGKGKAGLNLSGGMDGLCGKGQPIHNHSPGVTDCSPK